MKSSRLILALWLGTCAWAQVPQKTQATPPAAAKPNAAPKAAPTAPTKAATPNATPKTAAPAAQAKPAATATKHAPAAGKSHVRATSVAAKPVPSATRRRGRMYGTRPMNSRPVVASKGNSRPGNKQRDPFVSPVIERFNNAASCTGSGRQCLIVSEISLRGVVRAPSGFIAVVVNGDHTYFLRQNDPLADGSVVRITKDAIILQERSSDALGRPLTREITKKIGAAGL